MLLHVPVQRNEHQVYGYRRETDERPMQHQRESVFVLPGYMIRLLRLGLLNVGRADILREPRGVRTVFSLRIRRRQEMQDPVQ